ncbi:DNA-formamidopyrimidine glycosylase family protein [Galbitalea sp. SE-J8]|uniref:DNA-formamidopyrimidine glycosylase family protein n=1 Tax=Galbitalea sp. SE-J8 TaxID=3054952 RepID=UPI00259C9E4D|nr:DNA-formamidopyrimidine glycosylase family protein [Galbitalea sp. SE-J8]MDM4761575.1 DNA-formamidopyrimidine glycosylase family protein [Galbitalea sp. SE-J8]
MPEGDTVYLAAKNLRAALAGETLTRCDIRVPAFATVDLTGERVDEVVSRGKHLLMRVGDATIHTHLKMEGAWHVYRHGSAWRRPAWRARIILENAERVAVGFDLGIVEVVPRTAEAEVVGHLGPDLLGPDWDPDAAVANLAAQPDRAIGVAVLDQRNLAGLGNVYRSEVCFLRGVLPSRRVGDVSDLPGLVALAHRLIAANKDRHHRTTTGSLRRDPLWVYGRRGRPCLRCGTGIRTDEAFGEASSGGGSPGGGQERVVYWCPHCQT